MKANNVQELIKVSYVGPHGPKVGDTWYRLGKTVSVNMFKAGNTYAVQVGTGTNGAKFINKIDEDLGVTGGASVPPVLDPSVNKATIPTPIDDRPRRAGFGAPLTDYDLRIQEQISLAGLLQSAMVAIASHVPNIDKLISESQRVVEVQQAWITQKITEHQSK